MHGIHRTFRYSKLMITPSLWLVIDASKFLSSEPTSAFYLMQFDVGNKSLTSLLPNLTGWSADLGSLECSRALAEMIHSEITSHSFDLFPVSFDKINVTPCSCDVSSATRPELREYGSSVVKATFPASVHLISLTPKIAKSSLLISLRSCVTL